VVPDTVRIDYGDGSLLADAQAVGFGPVDAAAGSGQFGFGKSFFKVIPSWTGDFRRGAFGFGLFRAEENMALDLANPEVAGNFGQASSHVV
jgi:hypothetical protein